MRAGRQVRPRSAGIAGLDAVRALIGRQEPAVGAGHRLDADIGGGAREQVVILRVVVEQVPPQCGHVPRGGQVPFGGQPVHILEMRARHAQRLGGAVHPGGEGLFRPRDRFAQRGGGVVRGFDGGGADQVAQSHLRAFAEPDFRRRLGRGIAGDRHETVEGNLAMLDRLEHDVERHHLGERGRVQPRIGVAFVQHLSGSRVHHQRGVGRGERGRTGQRQGHYDECQKSADCLPDTTKSVACHHCLIPRTVVFLMSGFFCLGEA